MVGCPHDIKGQGIYAYVTLRVGVEPSDELLKELVKHVRKEIGPIATPDVIQWAPVCRRRAAARSCGAFLARLPKTRPDKVGDTSTLADPCRGRRPDREPAAQIAVPAAVLIRLCLARRERLARPFLFQAH